MKPELDKELLASAQAMSIKLYDIAQDPMRAEHAEIRKATLRMAAAIIDALSMALRKESRHE